MNNWFLQCVRPSSFVLASGKLIKQYDINITNLEGYTSYT